jgi:hypothetical protein
MNDNRMVHVSSLVVVIMLLKCGIRTSCLSQHDLTRLLIIIPWLVDCLLMFDDNSESKNEMVVAKHDAPIKELAFSDQVVTSPYYWMSMELILICLL